ncbi:MAG: T9SS type A sorting domain-containing protein [Saprospiraceae bacterium]|nr:T9SS type A sorting domain-containing protein [Saprospiraceae bacterium]
MCDLRLYLLSLLLFWVIKLNSQNSVVYYSSIPSSITTVQSAKANTYLDLTPYLSYQWISIGDAYLYLNNDTLELNLPDSNVICRYIFLDAEYLDTLNYYWSGEWVNQNVITPNHILLNSIGGMVSGEFIYNDFMYRLWPITPEYQILVKLDSINDEETADLPEIDDEEYEGICTSNNNNCVTDLLIVYPPHIESNNIEIINISQILTNQINTSFARSRIGQRVNLVGVAKITDTWTDGSISNDFNSISHLATNSASNLYALINILKADVVVLLTEGPNWSTGAFGRAIQPANPTFFCGAVKLEGALNNRYTFTHEVGHLFGAGHEDNFAPAKAKLLNTIYGYFETVMHQTGSNSKRILNYSNPTVYYYGEATGTDGVKCNANVIQNQGCVTSSLRPNPQCRIKATGTFDSECNPTSLTVSVQMEGSNCNVSYYGFEYSFDGFNFFQTFNPIIPVPTGTTRINVKIIAYNSSFQVITFLSKSFGTLCPQNHSGPRSKKLIKKLGENEFQKIQLSDFKLCYMYNIDGRLIKTIKDRNELVDFSSEFMITLPNGVYFLNIINENNNSSIFKLIK